MTLKQLAHSAYLTAFPQSATVTPRAHGIDISKYDLRFLPETATGQLDFVIQRASYRTTRDEAFTMLVDSVMRVPIHGAYHYLNSDTAWQLQADKFIEIVRNYDYHFYACDFEGSYNQLSTGFALWAWQWIHYVQEKTGKACLLYTSPSLYNQYIYPSQARHWIDWNTVGLWTAQWLSTPNPNRTPSNPVGRTAGWKLWQYTEQGNGPLYGVARPTACDLDVFNGTVQEMRDYFRIWETIPEPEEESDMAIEDAIRDSATLIVAKMGELIAAVKAIEVPSGGGDTPPPPPAVTKPSRMVTFIADNNMKVASWDIPDLTSISKCTFWYKNTFIEQAPRWNEKGMPKMSLEIIAREAEVRNLLREWAWFPRQQGKTAGQKLYSWPDENIAGNRDMSELAGAWIERKTMATPTDQAWIERIMAYVKAEWAKA